MQAAMDVGFREYAAAKHAQQARDFEAAHALYLAAVGTFMGVLQKHRSSAAASAGRSEAARARFEQIGALIRRETHVIMGNAEHCKVQRDAARRREREGADRAASLEAARTAVRRQRALAASEKVHRAADAALVVAIEAFAAAMASARVAESIVSTLVATSSATALRRARARAAASSSDVSSSVRF